MATMYVIIAHVMSADAQIYIQTDAEILGPAGHVQSARPAGKTLMPLQCNIWYELLAWLFPHNDQLLEPSSQAHYISDN